MNVKTTAPLAVAGVLGLVAAIVASQLVNQQTVVVGKGETVATAMNLTSVVMAKRDVAPGGVLSADDLTVAHVDAANAPAQPISDPAIFLGRVAKLQIPRGQILHEGSLAEKGVSGGLPGVIPAGFRAMTLEVNEFSGVAGLLEPGHRVDILARVAESDAGGNAGQMTRTVAQNITVIAVGASLTNKQLVTADPNLAPAVPDSAPAQRQPARSVTLLVTPEDAEKIDLAASTNQARLALRASTDNETAPLTGATLASIRGTGAKTDDAPLAQKPLTPLPTEIAGRSPEDTVFGHEAKPVSTARSTGRAITVIRAGVASTVDVDEPKKAIAAEPTASAD